MSPSDISSAMSLAIRSAWSRATSTPIAGVKSQALRGLFTRAITRGTENSERAIVATTRLSSSAPVTTADDLRLADAGGDQHFRVAPVARHHGLRGQLEQQLRDRLLPVLDDPDPVPPGEQQPGQVRPGLAPPPR